MNKAKAFLTILLSALGIFGTNEYYKPKNVKDLLKWRGINLASGDRVWSSMLFENKEVLQGMGIATEKAFWMVWKTENNKDY